MRSLELFQEAQRAFKDELHRPSLQSSGAVCSRAHTAVPLTVRPRSPVVDKSPARRPETAPVQAAGGQTGGGQTGGASQGFEFRVQRIPRTSSPFLKARILRTRERQIEELCSFGGPGLSPHTTGRLYGEKLLLDEDEDVDVEALVQTWLMSPLRSPWHFHLSRTNGRLYFVHDELAVATSEHPDERAMRRLMSFAKKVRKSPSAGVRLLYQEIAEIESRARRQLVQTQTGRVPDFEGWLEEEGEEISGSSAEAEAARREISEQQSVLVRNLKQYVSRIGVPQMAQKRQTVAEVKNSAHRKFVKSKQALDSASWLTRKIEDKNTSSVLEKSIKHNRHQQGDEFSDSLALRLRRSSMIAN